MVESIWTEERTARLMELRASGLGYERIAKEMGLSVHQARHKIAHMIHRGAVEKKESIWTDAMVARLIELQGLGWVYAAISRDMNLTDRQVRRKIERLQNNGILGKKPKMPRIPRPRPERVPRPPKPNPMQILRMQAQRRSTEPAVKITPPSSIANGLPIPRPRTCQWPLGEPRQPGFRFCDAPDLVAGRSYCHEHTQAAYCGYEGRNLAWWVPGPVGALGVYNGG